VKGFDDLPVATRPDKFQSIGCDQGSAAVPKVFAPVPRAEAQVRRGNGALFPARQSKKDCLKT
jgi:hypothetical protein